MTFPHQELPSASIAELRARLDSGEVTAQRLAEMHLERIEAIDREGPTLHAILEVNPDWEAIAGRLDAELGSGRSRGPLHGIPVLLKDNLDTGDRMLTTAGSLALTAAPAPADAALVAQLREAGALILGKTNLSEWANWRSKRSSSGWSARGGQCRNPHVLDRNPSGSSSGSAAAVAAGLAPLAVGTETDGSIVSPSSRCGVVGIKPGVGAVSRRGVVPISHSQDSPGAHARHTRDAALLLQAMLDEPSDLTSGLRPDALQGARLGVLREPLTGYSEHTDRIYEESLGALRELGAELVDPVSIATLKEMREKRDELESSVMCSEFKAGIAAYLQSRTGIPHRTLADLVRFNEEHAAEEMRYFRQEWFEASLAAPDLESDEYREALAACRRLSREEGLDKVLAQHRLDALLAPAGAPAHVTDLVNGDRSLGGPSQPSAMAGYPIVTVPAGLAFDVLPVGLAFFAGRGSEARLLAYAHAFEQAARAFSEPGYLPSLALE